MRLRIILLIIIPLSVFSQNDTIEVKPCFKKGTNVVGLETLCGLVFGTLYLYPSLNSNSISCFGANIALSYEYGLTEKLSMGLKLQGMSANVNSSDIRTLSNINGLIQLNFHFVKNVKFDFATGINVGEGQYTISIINKTLNGNQIINESSGTVFIYGFHFLAGYYFTKRIGLGFNLGYLKHDSNDDQKKNVHVNYLNGGLRLLFKF